MFKPTPALTREVKTRQPCANDLLRGWHDAEMGVPYQTAETDDWQMGWRLWQHEHGGRRGSAAWH